MVESALATEIAGILVGWQLRDAAFAPIIDEILGDLKLEGHAETVRLAIRDAIAGGRDPKPHDVAIKAAALDTSISQDDLFEDLRNCYFRAPAVSGVEDLKTKAHDLVASLRQSQSLNRRDQADQLLRTRGIDALADATDLVREMAGASIVAKPLIWVAPEDIPTRGFLDESKHQAPGQVSLTGAPGAAGKTSFIGVEAIAHVTGRNLLGYKVFRRGKAWIQGLEDPYVEHQRRFAAAALLHKIAAAELESRLFFNDASDDFVVARQTRDGVVLCEPIIAGITNQIKAKDITLLYIDPFVACHSVSENDNGAIDTVLRAWRRVALETGCAVELVCHLRKGNGNGAEPGVDDFRGASSMVPAARSARLLSTMSSAEAEQMGVLDRYRHFRIIDVKKNMAARAIDARWFELMPIDLRNGDPSDHVAAVQPWQPPALMDELTTDQTQELLALIAEPHYRENPQAIAWVGYPVATVLGLDPDALGVRSRVRGIVRRLFAEKRLKLEAGRDDRRKPVKFVVPA